MCKELFTMSGIENNGDLIVDHRLDMEPVYYDGIYESAVCQIYMEHQADEMAHNR